MEKVSFKVSEFVLSFNSSLYVSFSLQAFKNGFFRVLSSSDDILNQQSFSQLVVANPIGAVFSIIFLIAATLAAGCQFYFAISSLLKRSPAESLEKMKNYFKKINPFNKKVSCVKSDEDLHSDLNLILSRSKARGGFELFSNQKGRQRLSLLSLEERCILLLY